MTDKTRPEPPPVQSEMEQLRDSLDSLQTMVNRVREAVGTDQPAPVRESYRIRALEVRVSDAEYERDLARERAEAASRVGTQFMSRAERAEAALDRVRALHQPQHDGSGFPDSQQCSTCSQDGGDGYQYLVPWPCPTIRAIGEEPAPAPAATQATGHVYLSTGCRCHNGDELCSGCRRCPDICHGCDGPEYQPKEQ
jgi:hypothetical protein